MKKLVLGLLMIFVLGCTNEDKTNDTVADLPSVTIGTQIWTTKNLDVATYSDGTVIPEVTDPTQWIGLTTGAWCYYNNDAKNGASFGKLYNWYALAGIWDEASKVNITKRKKLAPVGWHIPTSTELNIVTDLKDTYGFAGLPVGYRLGDGRFTSYGGVGIWWSSTEENTAVALARELEFSQNRTYIDYPSKNYGLSIRCLRD